MIAYKHLVIEPVFECDGLLYLRVGDHKAVVLKHSDGKAVQRFNGRWQPVALYIGLQCAYFLALEDNTEQATWIVAPDGRRLGDKLADLTAQQRGDLRDAAMSHGLGNPDALIRDGIQFIEPTLLRDILALARSGGGLATAPGSAASPDSRLAMLQAPGGLVTHLRCTRDANGLQLGEGWSRDKSGIARATGQLSVARGEPVPPASRYLLTLTLLPVAAQPSLLPAEIGVSVHGSPVATLKLDARWQEDGADFAFWLPPERMAGKPFEIAFTHTQDFTLLSLKLEHGRSLAVADMAPSELMLRFENIGDNCEFGLVQRHFEAEPVGLLRFAGLRNPHRLIRFLDDKCGKLGEPGSLGVSVIGGEYWIIDNVYGLAYHTFRHPHEVAAEDVIRQNEVKATYLKRKFLEDLEDGEKIMVYKRVVTQDPHEMLALHAALNRFGTVNRLFWVTQADAQHAAGEVEWIGDRLLKGYLERISLEDAHDFSPDVWLRLCRNALAAFEAVAAR